MKSEGNDLLNKWNVKMEEETESFINIVNGLEHNEEFDRDVKIIGTNWFRRSIGYLEQGYSVDLTKELIGLTQHRQGEWKSIKLYSDKFAIEKGLIDYIKEIKLKYDITTKKELVEKTIEVIDEELNVKHKSKKIGGLIDDLYKVKRKTIMGVRKHIIIDEYTDKEIIIKFFDNRKLDKELIEIFYKDKLKW